MNSRRPAPPGERRRSLPAVLPTSLCASIPSPRIRLPIPLQPPLPGQLIERVATAQHGAPVSGQRLPGDRGAVAAGAGKEGIQRHREIEPLVEAALAEIVTGVGPGAPGADAHT